MRNYYSFFLILSGLLAFAQTPCNQPTNLTVQSVYDDGATLTWEAATPAPWNGYDYFWSASASASPNGSTPPDGTTFNLYKTISGIDLAGATIYFWVRSSCSGSNSSWRGPVSFTIIPNGSGCPVAPNGLYPTTVFTPAYTGSPELINADAYAGQYCKVNLMSNRQYVFNTSNPNDYITIANINNAAVIAHGPSPLVYNNTAFDGPVRYYISSNSSCGSQEINRSRYITGQLIPTGCTGPGNFYTSSISTTGAILHWENQNATYPTNFQYYYSTSGTTPNINQTPSGTTTFEYKDLTGLAPNTTYHYWVRANCGSGLSNWVYGGNFTTQATAVSGCTNALYGQNPSSVFIPGCFGTAEIISTNMWAGEYSLINVLPNKIYTFTSSVATDFITIRDNGTSVAYASGTTPLVWSSGANTAQIKMFVHLSVSCGSQNSNRTTTITCQDSSAGCAPPSALSISAVTNSSANVGWMPASPQPANVYQYYYSTSNTAPGSGTAPSGSSVSSAVTLTGLAANTTYYIWVRSNCATAQSTWVFGNSFTTVGAGSGCLDAPYGQYPDATFTPACFGNNETIVTDAYAGEYSRVFITSNTQYTFSSSAPSDYITITNANASVTYTAGNTPLVWNSGSNSGEIRYYFHANSACGSNNVIRAKYIACQSAGICGVPGGLSASTVTSNSATLNWMAVSPAPSGGYQYYLSTSPTLPGMGTPPTGSTVSPTISLTGLTSGVTYYFWVRSNCGTSQSAWSSVWEFTATVVPVTGCTVDIWGQYPSSVFSPACGSGTEVIVNNAYAGEYSMVTISPNKQYTFSTSNAADFITIANNDASIVFASGTTPVVWSSGGNSGVFRYYINTDSQCGYDVVERIRRIACATQLGEDETSLSRLQCYPNPVKETLSIRHSGIIDRVDVFNLLGQQIRTIQTHDDEVSVDFSDLAKGLYTVRIFSGTQSRVFKIVKE